MIPERIEYSVGLVLYGSKILRELGTFYDYEEAYDFESSYDVRNLEEGESLDIICTRYSADDRMLSYGFLD